MILILDHFDSFTYNLYHYFDELLNQKNAVTVVRCDSIEVKSIYRYDAIVLSPGPGKPSDYKVMTEFLESYNGSIPVLGVCLGHQAICEAHGATLTNMEMPLHGIQKKCFIKNSHNPIFKGMYQEIDTGHYHSWIVSNDLFPSELSIDATDEQQRVMAISHKTKPLTGIQFHPESVMTPNGKQMLKNWIDHYQLQHAR